MTSTLLMVQIILSIAITISVLLQKSSSIGLGAYSGSNESMFGAKGPMGFLAKITFGLAIFFVTNTLALGYLYTKDNNKSVVDTVKSVVPVSPEKVAPVAPAAPLAPVAVDSKVSPAAPSIPQKETTATPEPVAKTDKTAPVATPVIVTSDSNITDSNTTTQQ